MPRASKLMADGNLQVLLSCGTVAVADQCGCFCVIARFLVMVFWHWHWIDVDCRFHFWWNKQNAGNFLEGSSLCETTGWSGFPQTESPEHIRAPKKSLLYNPSQESLWPGQWRWLLGFKQIIFAASRPVCVCKKRTPFLQLSWNHHFYCRKRRKRTKKSFFVEPSPAVRPESGASSSQRKTKPIYLYWHPVERTKKDTIFTCCEGKSTKTFHRNQPNRFTAS